MVSAGHHGSKSAQPLQAVPRKATLPIRRIVNAYLSLSSSTIRQVAREKMANLRAEPRPARKALSPNGSQHPSRRSTPRQPNAAAVRNNVPMLPGS
eukprot:scaffold873_cov393-Prasinococcus_capsulatus_cf.AAC.9